MHPAAPADVLNPRPVGRAGLAWAVGILIGWGLVLGVALVWRPDWNNEADIAWAVGLVLLLTHLYTGMFITAHDAMHGLVSGNKAVNHFVGTLAALLFAYNWYPVLRRAHMRHHTHPATADDPDYHGGPFLAWYLAFARQYVTVWQIVAMAITYNLLKIWLPAENLILFWMAPAVLSTLQLFYFGTYLPHRGEHAEDNIHKARSQRGGHVWAFVSCYFFGYHHEHHAMPWLPWWRLPKAVN